jgi:ketosteroid isomerase-like protein
MLPSTQNNTKGETMSITADALHELTQRWAMAEIAGDASTLDALAVDDFTLVGPVGFVLNKQQWLDRYRQGDLLTRSLSFEDTTTRVYGDAAVTIGRHRQEAEYRGHPANGEFRATHIAVLDGSRWLLAGEHLSPIGPPPFAGPPSEEVDAR